MIIRHNPDSEIQRYNVELDGIKQTGWGSPTSITGVKDKSVALVTWATELYRDFLLARLSKGITEEDILIGVNQHKEKKEEAGNIGKETHDWVEKHIKFLLGKCEHPDMPENPAVLIGVQAWIDFENEHKIKYHAVEEVVASLKDKWAGRFDIDATIDGKRGIIDLKTSNGLYNTVRLQTAMYAKAVEEEKGKEIYKVRWAVRVAKETEEEYIARMKKKGKEVFEKYQVFEAMNLDEGGRTIDEDYEIAMCLYRVKKWDEKTDFYKLKNNK